MKMFNKLPQSVFINNREIFVNVDYRIFVEFEIDMQENDTKTALKKCLSAFYPAFIFENGLTEEMIDKMIDFYKSGRKEIEKEQNGKKKKQARSFDYNVDDELIFGAFMGQYGIDLSKANLHWWKFNALMKSLKDDCEFVKRKGYRIYTGDNKELLKLKEYYKLPPTKRELEDSLRQQKLYEALK